MSLLIEALRSADAARAKTATAPGDVSAPGGPIAPPDGARRIRWTPIAALAAAAIAIAFGWLWLQAQPRGAPPVGQRAAEAPGDAAAPAPAASGDLAQAQPSEVLRAEASAAAATRAARAARPVARRAPPVRVAAAPATTGAVPAPPVVEIEKSPSPDLQTAYAALRAGRHDEASRLYARLAEVHPYNADVLFGLAFLAEARGDRARAVTGYRRVLQADPDHADALAALVELSAGRDPAPQASLLRTALARRPDSPSLHAALGRLLAAEGRWSEARQAFASASKLAPRRADYAFNLAVALDQLGDGEGARVAYLRAADLAAADPQPVIDASVAAARARALAEQRQLARQP